MDGNRFDRWSRFLRTVGPRRTLVGLTLALEVSGLLSLTNVSAAKGCKPKCRTCKECKNGRCKKVSGTHCWEHGRCKDGKCKCQKGGFWCDFELCCKPGQACREKRKPGTNVCNACTELDDPCDSRVAKCGIYGPESHEVCVCMTSADDVTLCAAPTGLCVDCASDAECKDVFGPGVPAVCVVGACFCNELGRACFPAGCFDAGLGARGDLRRELVDVRVRR
jgi:hypothetical protein